MKMAFPFLISINACIHLLIRFYKAHLQTQHEHIVMGPVVQRLDNAIHRINHYPVDSVVCFVNTYPLDSDLSAG